jgi:serine/threonine protein kinase
VAVALEIASRTSSALSAAYGARDDNGHPLRILHRDIKPGNLLLSTHGQVKVIDFGLSRGDYYERETSTISTLVGSLGYMAPERFMGSQKASPSIDVYSVGITLAELLCGRPPVLPRSPDAHPDALRRYLTYVAPDLSSSCRDPLITLLSEMCSADPSARPSHEETQRRLREIQVAGEMSTDLTAFVSRVVKPRDRDRPRVEPKAHPAWEDIQFLEDPNAPLPNRLVSDPSPGPVSDTQTNDRVREFLNSAQWETRKRELKWLLAVHPNWSSEPFLEVLQRGTQPWWRFWSRSASESEMALALEVLKHRLSPRLLDMARGLTDHPNARVATAASVLIERYKGEH